MTNRKTDKTETGTIFHKGLKFSVALLALAMHTAFAEDAYIENTNGNQYFNTGHFVGPNTKIVLDFKLNETTLGITPFGAQGSNGTAFARQDIQVVG